MDIFVTMQCSFLSRHSNLGIPGVWAFHIGSSTPLDNVRPATVRGDLSIARASPPLEQSFSPAAALESDDAEDNLDYYDENEEEVEYPPSEPEEVSNGHGSTSVSSHSRADSRPLGVGFSPSDSDLASPLPHRPRSNRPFYPETESATLDPQTKEGRPAGEMDTPDIRGQVESFEQPGARGLAPSNTERDSLDLSQKTPPPHLENRSIRPYPNGGALPSERDVPPAHPEGEVVLNNYPAPGHTPPLGHGRHVVGVEDNIHPNTEGKWVGKQRAKIPFKKCWFYIEP